MNCLRTWVKVLPRKYYKLYQEKTDIWIHVGHQWKSHLKKKSVFFFLNRIEIFFWCFQNNLGEGGLYNFNKNGHFTLSFSMDLSYGNNTKDITGSLHSVPKQIKFSCRWPRLKSLINLIDIQSLICSLHQLYFMNLFSF